MIITKDHNKPNVPFDPEIFIADDVVGRKHCAVPLCRKSGSWCGFIYGKTVFWRLLSRTNKTYYLMGAAFFFLIFVLPQDCFILMKKAKSSPVALFGP